MDVADFETSKVSNTERRAQVIKATAPGTALRHALDMILAGHLGALICIGDTENVLAAGDDGFKLDVSFTANRLFELCKMDGAVVVDKDLTRILRANFHLNPDPSISTTETGTRHRTAARMSLLTKAMVISVSERRQVVHVYADGIAYQIRPAVEIVATVNQLTNAMQNTRQQIDSSLARLTLLELDDFVTLGEVASVFYKFEVLMTAADELDDCIKQLGTMGKTALMQREEYLGEMEEAYLLMIRDYAKDSSPENAKKIRKVFHQTANTQLRSAKSVARILGYDDDRGEDCIMTPLGLRTLSRVGVVRDDLADVIVNEYGSLPEILEATESNPDRLGEIGVNNPDALANSLRRMWGKEAQ